MIQTVCDIQPMQSNTHNADRASARVSAKKIGADMWIYRGWIIRRWNNNYLNDPEIRGFQYNTYENEEAYRKSQMTDIAGTLKDAKMYIDICEDRKIKLGDFLDSNLTFNDLLKGVK